MDQRGISPVGHSQEIETSGLDSWGLTTLPTQFQTMPLATEILQSEPHASTTPPPQATQVSVSAQSAEQLQQMSSMGPRTTHLTDPAIIPYPASFYPTTFSMGHGQVAANNAVAAPIPATAVNLQHQQTQNLEILKHGRFEELVRAVFYGRQIGEDPEKKRLINEQQRRALESIMRARVEAQNIQRSSTSTNNPDLDLLLRNYLKLVQGLNQELTITQNEANSACAMFEQQIRAITNSATQVEGPVALSSSDDDHLRSVLKRKYGEQIRQLSDEFRRKKKKGKLPVNATDVLRNWWDNNLSWPYPSEDEKRTLAGQTDLNATQINNWFINQRKRHWHKFFKDGRLPQSPEEAAEILKQQGVLP